MGSTAAAAVEWMYYRARKNGLQNIVQKDPGRARLNSQGTAGRNFTKPCSSHFFGLCTEIGKKAWLFAKLHTARQSQEEN